MAQGSAINKPGVKHIKIACQENDPNATATTTTTTWYLVVLITTIRDAVASHGNNKNSNNREYTATSILVVKQHQ